MNKKIISALTTTLIVGAASTTFAAANPFSDVPAGHWAYDAVTQLAADGIIEGYGDNTYLGNRNITRYEMAQMIARAMAKNGGNVSGTDKAALDRLASEFADELNNLGVRVSNLEKYADKVKWTGKIEYTYTSERTDPDDTGHKSKENSDGFVFRFEPEAEVNKHWSLHARIDAEANMKDDTGSSFDLVRGWAEGDYDNFNVKVGKMELYTNESGLIWDTEFSGAQLTVGNKLTATLLAGRIESETVGGGSKGEFSYKGNYNEDGEFESEADPTSIQGINLQYDVEKGLYGGAGFYHLRDSDFGNEWYYYGAENGSRRNQLYSNSGKEDTANIWSVNAGYKFGEKATLWGSYAQNTTADFEDDAWQAEVDFGNYGDNPEKGDWGIWAGYRRYGTNVSFAATTDDVLLGTKGWFIGGGFAPMKNVGLVARYFNGEYITGSGDAEKLFGRVEFFF